MASPSIRRLSLQPRFLPAWRPTIAADTSSLVGETLNEARGLPADSVTLRTKNLWPFTFDTRRICFILTRSAGFDGSKSATQGRSGSKSLRGGSRSTSTLSVVRRSSAILTFGLRNQAKAVNFPTERWQGRSDDIRARLEHQVVALRRRQLADGHARVVSADGFGECLRAARSNLEASIDGLSRDTGIPKALLEDVETSKRSPVRIPAEKMTELLQRLHMAFDETVELVRSSAERWALQTFPQGQTQLGRVGRDLSPKERREIQESSSTHDVDSDIKREMQRIDEYADVLRQRIQSVSPKF